MASVAICVCLEMIYFDLCTALFVFPFGDPACGYVFQNEDELLAHCHCAAPTKHESFPIEAFQSAKRRKGAIRGHSSSYVGAAWGVAHLDHPAKVCVALQAPSSQ